MSTSGTFPYEEIVQEVALLKKQVSELMRMVQQLVVGGGLNSFGHNQGGPQTENENSLHRYKMRAIMYYPRAITRKQIFLRIRTPCLGMAKSRAKRKL